MPRRAWFEVNVTIRFAALCAGLLIVLAGCASRPDAGALAVSTLQAPGATTHDILVVSTRERDDRPNTYFNGERAKKTDFAEATISVPPNHKPGTIEWPSILPGDPKKDFVLEGSKAQRGRPDGELPPPTDPANGAKLGENVCVL